MAWPELYQEYVLMAENIQDRAYYQSKDEKWALSWSSSGWGLGAAAHWEFLSLFQPWLSCMLTGVPRVSKNPQKYSTNKSVELLR